MSIRAKIILIVLPLILTTLLLAGVSSYFSATAGITKIAKEFLGFKGAQLENYAAGQWSLLVENNFTTRQDYVIATQKAVEDYARNIIRSDTEIILAIGPQGNIVMATSEVKLESEEKNELLGLAEARKYELVNPRIAGKDRVAMGFYFDPFKWYILVSEDRSTFYRAVYQITIQTGIIMGVSLMAALIMLLILARYLTKPLTKVVGTMKDIISYNDLSERVLVEYHDEIGQLAHTFNIMIGELEKAYNQIKGFAFKAVLAQKKEQKIRNIFQKYVPNDVIEQFFRNPESMLVGDNRIVSVLFSDIRSFTTISESMQPDDLVSSLNRYFSIMVDIIINRNGVVDKYIGDAIMAFFGAPTKHEDDAVQSVLAGIEMTQGLQEFNAQQEELDKPQWQIGVGINYGVVTVGNIGTEKKMDYTVIGDMVNLASRCEGLTKKYHQTLIITESLQSRVKDSVHCRLLDRVAVKGKTKGVEIFTAKKDLTEEEKRGWVLHHEGMKYYYDRQFEKAADRLKEVQQILPKDYISEILFNRCTDYAENPPPKDWDGVEVMKEK
ncbi:MAG TPA: adenylate/guanylate cyclase domain-containing protein [Spirochaetia bacterium]|nr:adenylate/guanylate cyclase domain-containing protein [Spirochaetia bacterium]